MEYAYGLQAQPTDMRNWCQHISNYANDRARGLDPLINILKTGMLKMDPMERFSADECLRRIKTDLPNDQTLDNVDTTQTQKTALQDQAADSNGSPTAIPGFLRGRVEDNVSPGSVSETQRQKSALQKQVAYSYGPTTTITGLLRSQKTSNFKDNGSPGRVSETKTQKMALQEDVAIRAFRASILARASCLRTSSYLGQRIVLDTMAIVI